jgi:hypothetical protein
MLSVLMFMAPPLSRYYSIIEDTAAKLNCREDYSKG